MFQKASFKKKKIRIIPIFFTLNQIVKGFKIKTVFTINVTKLKKKTKNQKNNLGTLKLFHQ